MEDESEDIQQATGMEWSQLLLPLLMCCGLITFREDSMVKEGPVLVEQCEELGLVMSQHTRIQIMEVRQKGKDGCSLFCLGCPTHPSPTEQQRNTDLSLHDQTVMERQLAIDMKNSGTTQRLCDCAIG